MYQIKKGLKLKCLNIYGKKKTKTDLLNMEEFKREIETQPGPNKFLFISEPD